MLKRESLERMKSIWYIYYYKVPRKEEEKALKHNHILGMAWYLQAQTT